MDTLTLVSTLYKQEVARVIEQQILFQAQCKLLEAQLEAKTQEVNSLGVQLSETKQELQYAHDENEDLQEQLSEYIQTNKVVEIVDSIKEGEKHCTEN